MTAGEDKCWQQIGECWLPVMLQKKSRDRKLETIVVLTHYFTGWKQVNRQVANKMLQVIQKTLPYVSRKHYNEAMKP